MRSVYSVAIIRAERNGTEEPPNPFTHGDERFLEWVRGPQPPEVMDALAPRDNLLARISELEQIRDEAIAWAEREGDARQVTVAERDALAQQLEHARSVMTHVLSSPSWRLTRPLRSVKTAAKALRQV
jgi:chromatin segregation and condensation protein Rec8/ScpA/Scc1 (kleisin family)